MAHWIIFAAVVGIALAIDLGFLEREERDIGFREAILLSLCWIGLALAFNAGLWYVRGPEDAKLFFTGYLLEKSLGLDNLFVFVVIFKHFKIPQALQRRVLYWGILSALVMRGIFIFAGIALIERFHFVMYLFGIFLVYTAVKLFRSKDEKPAEHGPMTENRLISYVNRLLPKTDSLVGNKFFISREGRIFATPLFHALIAIEVSDVLFAFDSVPAILAISSDTFIVYSSNVFAILGLRSLYFVLAGMVEAFAYLPLGLAGAIGFIGVKILVADFYKIPSSVSLMAIAGFLSLGILLSIFLRKRDDGRPIDRIPS